MKNEKNWDDCLRVTEPDTDGRSAFEKDYDRIVFSQAFRRLARKTQVHPLAINDHIHNRMSHSHEVSIVGRSIVSKIGSMGVIPENHLNNCKMIVMAAGLGHDMGNPPFGHVGEDAISKWVESNHKTLSKCKIEEATIETYRSFDGNAQNFHLFNHYEYFSKKPLSNPCLATLVKYPIESSRSKKKSGYFSFDNKKFEDCFTELNLVVKDGFKRHPLSYLMEAADDICYGIMDLDDAIEMGFLETGGKEFIEIMEKVFNVESFAEEGNIFREKRGSIIEQAVTAAADTFKINCEKIFNGEIEIGMDLIELGTGTEILDSIKEMKALASKRVFRHRRKVELEASSYAIITRILDNWLSAFEDYSLNNGDVSKINSKSKKIFELLEFYDSSGKIKPRIQSEGLTQAVDFVSGMTDRYANDISKSLAGFIL